MPLNLLQPHRMVKIGSPAFTVNKPFPVSTFLEQEVTFILVDCAAIKCIIGSKVIEVMFHSKCRSCIKKSLFQ